MDKIKMEVGMKAQVYVSHESEDFNEADRSQMFNARPEGYMVIQAVLDTSRDTSGSPYTDHTGGWASRDAIREMPTQKEWDEAAPWEWPLENGAAPKVRRIESDGQAATGLYGALLAEVFSIPTVRELANWDLAEFYSRWDGLTFHGPVIYRDWHGNVLIITDASHREIHVRFVGDIPCRVTIDYGEEGSSRAAGQTIARLREQDVAACIRLVKEDSVLGWDSTPQEYPAAETDE